MTCIFVMYFLGDNWFCYTPCEKSPWISVANCWSRIFHYIYIGIEWLDELLPCTVETDALYIRFSFFFSPFLWVVLVGGAGELSNKHKYICIYGVICNLLPHLFLMQTHHLGINLQVLGFQKGLSYSLTRILCGISLPPKEILYANHLQYYLISTSWFLHNRFFLVM